MSSSPITSSSARSDRSPDTETLDQRLVLTTSNTARRIGVPPMSTISPAVARAYRVLRRSHPRWPAYACLAQARRRFSMPASLASFDLDDEAVVGNVLVAWNGTVDGFDVTITTMVDDDP